MIKLSQIISEIKFINKVTPEMLTGLNHYLCKNTSMDEHWTEFNQIRWEISPFHGGWQAHIVEEFPQEKINDAYKRLMNFKQKYNL